MRGTERYAALNRRARHDYLIEDTLEAGLVLHGTEVKSLRQGGASIAEAYADAQSGELFLVNANIPEYAASAHFNHLPRRPRKLLLHRKQMNRLLGAIRREAISQGGDDKRRSDASHEHRREAVLSGDSERRDVVDR